MTQMSDYQRFICLSRYARWNGERRETWGEIVSRYMTYMQSRVLLTQEDFTELKNAIENLEVLPSMRALMTAGPALERDNIAGYNCAYLPIDSPRSFDETMYILMCGTGVGYSVESKYTGRLPEISEHFEATNTIIHVGDSKSGWARGLRELIALLYSGQIPSWDLSAVRPAGAPLRTFGGRASGPGPLDSLFRWTVSLFVKAKGRRLTSLECHDLMCKIGEVVVVGGVRRSAMISLSDLNDHGLRSAKNGNWWEQNGQRALSNNSAVYEGKPELGQFLEEWTALYNSHSGERGLFNRRASQRQAGRFGRRPEEVDYGTNPCSEIILQPFQFCNLTEVVVRADDTGDSLRRKVRLATILGTFQATLTNFKYLRKQWQSTTESERLLGVSLTGILDNPAVALDAQLLGHLREYSVKVNKDYAHHFGIPLSAAITCVKPSGTVSQLVDSASGIHPRHSAYYVRTVRGDIKDPMSQFLMAMGVPNEPDITKPNDTVVFSFPQKSPEGSVTREHLTAIEHLEIWKTLQENWCEHKPSITINVREDEWMEVGAWVWKNFDICSGVAFLPYSDHTYKQAPYQDITAEEYEARMKDFPKDIDWSRLSEFEKEDTTTGSQELACSGGVCEIVDLVGR